MWLAVLVGCGGEPGAPEPDARAAERQGQIAAPGGIADAEALRRQAHAALTAGRLHAPAGDNAVERFLALREQGSDDAAATEALVALQPYVLIGAEQALAAADRAEAGRLVALLERMDAHAPALPRLQAALQALPATAALPEPLPLPVPEAAAGPAPGVAEARGGIGAPERPGAVPPVPSGIPVGAGDATGTTDDTAVALDAAPPDAPSAPPAEETPAAAPPSGEARAAATTAALPVPQGAVSPADPAPMPALLFDVAPRYPTVAMNRRLEGSVVLAFTIGPGGQVTGARVVSADPAGVFDRAALQAAERWRFEATGRSHPTTRVLRFSLADADQG